MRAAAWSDEPTSPGGGPVWLRSTRSRAFDVPDWTLSGGTSPTDWEEPIVDATADAEDLLVTEEVPKSVLLAMAAALPRARADKQVLPAIDSGPNPRPEDPTTFTTELAPTTSDDASTGVFEAWEWDEADPYTGNFPSIAARVEPLLATKRPSLTVVCSAPDDPADAAWAELRAAPLPTPPRPAPGLMRWPPAPAPTLAERPLDASQQIITLVDDLSEGITVQEAEDWALWNAENPIIEPRRSSFWVALALNFLGFTLGFLATFGSGSVALASSTLVLIALL